MNGTNLNCVADAIEARLFYLGYDQKEWLKSTNCATHECKTTACLSGWTATVMLGRVPSLDEACDVEATAAFLGLDHEESGELFRATPLWIFQKGSLDPTVLDPTAIMAVRTLRYAADHGVVDWYASNDITRPGEN